MNRWRVFVFGVGCFVFGLVVQAGVAQKAVKPTFSPSMIQGDPKAVAATLLDAALVLAEEGSWEKIAVGRAWYLGGDKAKGQAIFDGVTTSKKVAGSDWFRIGRVYMQAGEWAKAKEAFDKTLERNAGDDSAMIEYGALANINNDRVTAEALFTKAFAKGPKEFWHFVGAGGSYLGVRPQ